MAGWKGTGWAVLLGTAGALLGLGCAADDDLPAVEVLGVYVVAERFVSRTCGTDDMAPEDTPSHVELAMSGQTILLYPCERVEEGRCYALLDNAYAVGTEARLIENGYEVEELRLSAGTASCFAGYIDGKVERVDDQVLVADLRRGGIVPGVSPAACDPENVVPETLPCLWYEELTLDPL